MKKLFVNENLKALERDHFGQPNKLLKQRITNTTGPQTDTFMLERKNAVKQ